MSKSNEKNPIVAGFLSMIPVVPGIVPFGMIMGTVAFEAGLSMPQTMGMNIVVFAGASQLAAIDLLTKDTHSVVIVLTGLIINLRFLLYSAASSSYLKESSFLSKLWGAYSLTDQSYAVTSANERKLKTVAEKLHFSVGATACMTICWQFFVLSGFYFGNIIPKAFSLDFAVPLSFMALTIPSLISKTHLMIAIVSTFMSLTLRGLPLNLGLICTTVFCIFLADRLERRNESE